MGHAEQDYTQLIAVIEGAEALLAEAEAETATARGHFERVEDEKQTMLRQWKAEVAAATAKTDAMSDTIVDLRAHVARLEGEIDKMTASASWKLTWPLRYIGSKVHRGAADAPDAAPPPAPQTAPAPAPAAPPAQSSAPCVLTPQLPDGEHPPDIEAMVSFIIPTFNGGDVFGALLESLIWQAGLKSREIIVVDSGSSDGTAERAEQQGAKVVRIPQAEFTHAHARNLGARQASGAYLIFMTQDAMPTGPWWARYLLHPLLDNTLQAVSCAEQPREDADLFYALSSWHHTRMFVARDGQDRIGALPDKPDAASLRENAALCNVASALPAWTFRQYPFRGAYGEDIDLGLRIIRGGGKIAFLSSVKVLHSHNRPIVYYAKRAFVDAGALEAMLPAQNTRVLAKSRVLGMMALQYAVLAQLRRFIGQLPAAPMALDSYRRTLAIFIRYLGAQPAAPLLEGQPELSGDAAFDALLARLWEVARPAARAWSSADMEGATAPFMEFAIYTLYTYCKEHHPVLDAPLREETAGAFARFYAWNHFGHPMAALLQQNPEDPQLQPFAETLREGV